MTTKQYLSLVLQMDNETKMLEEMILETRTRLEKTTPVLSDMPKANSGTDKIGDGVAKIIELENRLKHHLYTVDKERIKIIDEIYAMKNPVYRMILTERYINGESLEKISVKLNYSYYYTCKLHGQALEDFRKMTSNDKYIRGKVVTEEA